MRINSLKRSSDRSKEHQSEEHSLLCFNVSGSKGGSKLGEHEDITGKGESTDVTIL